MLRRSTTDWTWLRLLRSVARSMVAFMSLFCPFLFLHMARMQSNPGDNHGWFFITAVAAWASTRWRFPTQARLQNGTGLRSAMAACAALPPLLALMMLFPMPAHGAGFAGHVRRMGCVPRPRDPALLRHRPSPAARNGVATGAAFAAVGTWPRQQVRGQVHFRLSRTRAAKAPVTLSVGERRFALVGGQGDAWGPDPRGDAAIVAAMRSAGSMSVATIGSDGRAFADSYALRGAATAIDAAALGCARLR